jgi:predicted transcriptional regulator of viral defense system
VALWDAARPSLPISFLRPRVGAAGGDAAAGGHAGRRSRLQLRQRLYYLSHVSAMDVHGMLTQPQLLVHVTSPAPMRGRTILGTEFRFVRCKPSDSFGTAEHWVEKQEKVVVSDLERTVLDGLKQPEYCGGFTQVANGLWMRRVDANAKGSSSHGGGSG